MKKHFRLLMAAVLMGSMAFFASCGNDDDDDDVEPTIAAPTIQFVTGGDDVALALAATHDVKILAEQTGAELTKLEVIATIDGTATTILDSAITGTTFTYETTLVKTAVAEESYTFTVTNSDGKTASESVTLTLEVSTPFGYENTEDGVLNHRWGLYPGAYDLVANAQLAQSEPEANKDMENDSPNDGTFVATWAAGDGNTTTFAKADGYDYDNATVETATAAFADGSSSVTEPAVAGDVYIAKLRGTDEYCVIKINEVSEVDKGGTGYIDFKYKKTSATAGE